jgi:hypothetical protein
MKRLLTALALAAASVGVPAFGADVGVSISVGQPGFYGQIDIGSYGRPPVLYSRPITIERVRRDSIREPLYLRVPPGHSRNWKRYCASYNACGRPVYFVQDSWYKNVYAPRYNNDHRDDRRDEHRGNGDKNDRKDNGRGGR